mmetsp:Transcript_73627/g.209725  ORF Transcript_73627/g.209725 Transcript_73627/m.209725 type:complete len:580 (-) Transcript_73627:412-2151(-)
MMRSQRYNPEQKDDTDFRYKLYEVHAGRTGSDEDDEYGGGWSKSPTRCEDEGGFHCHLFNLSLDLSLLFTLVVFACSIMGMVAVRVPRLQFWQGRVALFGGLSGLVAVFVFGGLFPIRKACVAFYKRIDDDDDGDDVYADDECDDPFTDDDCITTEHDTCSYGGGYWCEWVASFLLCFSAQQYFELTALRLREAYVASATYTTAAGDVTYAPLPGGDPVNAGPINAALVNAAPINAAEGAAFPEGSVTVISSPSPIYVAAAGAIENGAAETTCEADDDTVKEAAIAGVYRTESNLSPQPVDRRPEAIQARARERVAAGGGVQDYASPHLSSPQLPPGYTQASHVHCGCSRKCRGCYYPMVIILFVALWIGSDNLFNANPYSGGDGLCDIIPDSCPVGNGFSTYGPVDGEDFNAPCALCDDQTCCTQEGYDNKVDYTTFVTNPGLSNSCHELLSKMSCAPCSPTSKWYTEDFNIGGSYGVNRTEYDQPIRLCGFYARSIYEECANSTLTSIAGSQYAGGETTLAEAYPTYNEEVIPNVFGVADNVEQAFAGLHCFSAASSLTACVWGWALLVALSVALLL